MSVSSQVPVTLLTGFLGAGKTTLLNRILSEEHGERIAVIENEFGETGIDSDLLVNSEEQIVEMNNGCICCTVRGDLVRILGQLAQRRTAGEIDFERVIIETTGLADPAPVAQTFFVDEGVGNYYRLDAIVTVVDALHAPQQLDAHHEAQEQVGFADRILVSKADLVTPQAADALLERLKGMNARAPVSFVNFGHTDLAQILDVQGFNLDAILEIEPDFLEDVAHEHDDEISSFVFRASRPFRIGKLEEFLSAMLTEYGNDMLRYKGVLDVAGLPARVVFQGVHMMMGSDMGQKWQEGEARESVMVFIGRNLPSERFVNGLESCLSRHGAKA
ncbi:GTP-binding protein [Massilia sp. 9096]|uniref:CobW family GTP-binding protein n=1 Tax=Massilia sp. 9096 TaxID=1500894 RepID=UPI00055A2F9B|nr:GTP-binding protein [Massilia sp. 9096]